MSSATGPSATNEASDTRDTRVSESAAASKNALDLLHCVLRYAPTQRRVIESATRYLPLLGGSWKVALEVSEECAQLLIVSSATTAPSCDEAVLDLLLQRELFGEARALRICVQSPFGSDVKDNRRFHSGEGCVALGPWITALWFDALQLDLPRALSNPKLFELLHKLADEELAARSRSLSLAGRVRALVGERLSAHSVGLAEVASGLALSSRKLARRLAREDTTFQEIVDDVKRTRALELISTSDRSSAEIAALTGFGGQAAFNRAFRRWTTQAPRQYRWRTCGPVAMSMRSLA